VSASNWRLVFFVNVPIGLLALWLGFSLREHRREKGAALPDAVGIALVAVAMGLLALGIVQGHEWGWGSPAVLGVLAGAALLAVAYVLRARGHSAPAIDLDLFRSARFSLANLGTLAFAMAFYAMLLNNVLFLTGVWGYSTLDAGLALTPAPLAAAATALPAGRIADRLGHRSVILPGLVLYAIGSAYLIGGVGPHPSYVQHFLPAAVLTGIGVGLAFPALGSAAVHTLDAGRFGTGSAINSAARQVGAVLGVAVVVAIVSDTQPFDPLAPARSAWLFVTLAATAVVPLAALIAPVRAPARESLSGTHPSRARGASTTSGLRSPTA
jgi:MFS family permease